MRLNQDPSSQPRLLIGSGISQSGSRRIVSLVIPPEAAGQRLDIFLAAYTPSRRWA